MKLVEAKGTIAEDGSVILPPGVLESMGMKQGDSVFLTYLADKSVEAANTYSSVMLSRNGIEEITEPFDPADVPAITVPHLLLQAAGIPLDGELDIQCVPGAIVIGSADPLDVVPPCLLKLFDDFGINHDVVRSVLREGGF